jgi:hypothetical protein
METSNPKRASIDESYYKNKTTISKFSQICNKLKENNLFSGTEQNLSLLIFKLLQFQEENLGINSEPKNRAMTKLPINLFDDYEEDGSLYIILSSCYEFKSRSDWKEFDFEDEEIYEDIMIMLKEIKEQLEVNSIKLNFIFPNLFSFFDSKKKKKIKMVF